MAIQFRDRTIDDFKGKLVGGGAPPNLFEVELNFPAGLAPDRDWETSVSVLFL